MALLAMMLCGVKAFAETIMIEGEDYYRVSSSRWRIESDASKSNGKFLGLLYVANGDDENEVKYKVHVKKAGWYQMTFRSTALDFQFVSNFYVTVNDGKTINAREECTEQTLSGDKVWSIVDFGCVYLQEGTNYVKIVLESNRLCKVYLIFIGI